MDDEARQDSPSTDVQSNQLSVRGIVSVRGNVSVRGISRRWGLAAAVAPVRAAVRGAEM